MHFYKEEFEDNKEVISIRKSKKDRQHNDQKEKGQKNKQRSTKHTHKTKDRIPLKIRNKRRCSVRVTRSCSNSGNRRVNLVTNPVLSH